MPACAIALSVESTDTISPDRGKNTKVHGPRTSAPTSDSGYSAEAHMAACSILRSSEGGAALRKYSADWGTSGGSPDVRKMNAARIRNSVDVEACARAAVVGWPAAKITVVRLI